MIKLISTTLATVIVLHLSAQTKIKGVVRDSKGEAIPGVNILVKGSYDGASSSDDGSFSFATEEKGAQIIAASFVGYKTFEQQIELNGHEVDLSIKLQEEINQLDAVVISAGSFTAGEERRRTILKAVDIATTAGATADIAGALNTLPGTQKVGESGRLFVRGGDSNETRTFIDGMAVFNAYGPSALNTPSRGRFLPFMFKGTSFSTGGYSAEYGQGISSALVLQTKDKADMNQTDIGLLSVGGDAAHTQVWDKASWTGKVQYTDIRPYFKLIDQRVDWVNPVVSIEGSTAYRQSVGKDGMIKFFGNVNHSSLSYYEHGIADPAVRQLFDLKNDYRYGNASYKKSLNEKWSMRGGISYNYNSNNVHLDGGPEGDTEKGIHSKVVFENSVSDKVELKVGGEVISRNYATWRQIMQTAQTGRQSFTETISSFFAETEVYANNRFVARGGGRGGYKSVNGEAGGDPR